MSMLFILILQLVVPVGLLGGLAFGCYRGRSDRIVRIVIVASYLMAIALAGLWLILPWYTPLVYLALLVLSVPRSGVSTQSTDRRPGLLRGRIRTVALSVAATLSIALVAFSFAGRRPVSGLPVVELAFPLSGANYLIVSGGSNRLVNPHVLTLSGERFRPFRGQSYGVDIVKVNAWGFRATGLRPSDPAAYEIFGESVHAPCAGRVIQAEDGLRDLPPPQTDRENLGGNHVILECGEVWVLLGHLQQGSVRVAEAEIVEVGREIGLVGNSGNSDEPHLHIHAQQPGTIAAPLGGDPVPIRLDGRFLVRNSRVTSHPFNR